MSERMPAHTFTDEPARFWASIETGSGGTRWLVLDGAGQLVVNVGADFEAAALGGNVANDTGNPFAAPSCDVRAAAGASRRPRRWLELLGFTLSLSGCIAQFFLGAATTAVFLLSLLFSLATLPGLAISIWSRIKSPGDLCGPGIFFGAIGTLTLPTVLQSGVLRRLGALLWFIT
ncbi:MAG: hypothetical protein KDA96_16015 [Planctomycetaceae bacterium]|nr:hypothetical protein [Planctomycetaceae bacterium]